MERTAETLKGLGSVATTFSLLATTDALAVLPYWVL